MKKPREPKRNMKVFLADMRGHTPKELRSRIRAAVLAAQVTIALSKQEPSEEEPIEYSMLNWTVH
jgi:hypothetical protein